jgi:hypothetical protein
MQVSMPQNILLLLLLLLFFHFRYIQETDPTKEKRPLSKLLMGDGPRLIFPVTENPAKLSRRFLFLRRVGVRY